MKRCRSEIFCGVIIPLLFLAISMFVKTYFDYNAYPVDYEYIDSYDWANIFFKFYAGMSVICVILNAVIIPVLGTKANIHSQHAWFVYAIISLILALIIPIYITIEYREDSSCTFIMYIMFLLQYVLTFLVSTWKCPRHWDFFPTK